MAIDGANLYAQLQTNYEKFGIPELKRQGLKGQQLEEQIARYYQGIQHDAAKADSKAAGKALAREIALERNAAKSLPKPAVNTIGDFAQAQGVDLYSVLGKQPAVTKAGYVVPAVTGSATLPPGVTSEQFFDLVEKKYGNKYPGIKTPLQLPAGEGGALTANGTVLSDTRVMNPNVNPNGGKITLTGIAKDAKIVEEPGAPLQLPAPPKGGHKLTPEEIAYRKHLMKQKKPLRGVSGVVEADIIANTKRPLYEKIGTLEKENGALKAELEALKNAGKKDIGKIGKVGKFFKGKGGKAALIGAAVLAIGAGIGLANRKKESKNPVRVLDPNSQTNTFIAPRGIDPQTGKPVGAAAPVAANPQDENPAAPANPVATNPQDENSAAPVVTDPQNENPVTPATPAVPAVPSADEFAPEGIYTVVDKDCVWNIAKAKLTKELGRKPTNAEILRETYRIMDKNKEANSDIGTRKLEWAADHYHVMIQPGDKINLNA